MSPHFKSQPARTFVGQQVTMSLSDNRTHSLWRSFMPKTNEVMLRKGEELYSIEEYPEGYFLKHDPFRSFKKWAAVEVSAHAPVPGNMEKLVVPAGGYAVFSYKGPVSQAPQLFAYIFSEWLPDSDFEVDNRPHLGVMGKKYSNHADDSEEEFWIPVKPKRAINV